MLDNLSHEIRTPLNAVIGLANILIRTRPLSEKQKVLIEILRMRGDNLLTLINDLMDFARLEKRAVVLKHVEVDLIKTVQNIIRIMTVRAGEKNLHLFCDFSALLPLIIWAIHCKCSKL